MTRFVDSNPPETTEERELRTFYSERAPAQVETMRAWAATAPRLTLRASDASERRDQGARGTRVSGRRPGWRTRLGIAAAILALPVALMGAGLVKENLPSVDPGMQRIADERLYQYINQSQTHAGVTVTITAAYADEGRTVFYYRVQMAPELAQQYGQAFIGSWNLTDSQDAAPVVTLPATGGIGVCSAWDSATRSHSCYQVDGPFQPGASARQIALTLDITRVYLLPRASNGHDQLTGHWRFQFSMPFHHINVGSAEQFFPHLLHLASTNQQP